MTCLYLYDGLGNPIALSTAAATTSYNLRYDPYGATTRIDGGTNNGGVTDNPYVYSRGMQDRATGQIKNGQRWFNPTTGGWTQQDTLNTPLDPANAYRYEYAGDDPINQADPSGRDNTCYEIGCGGGPTAGTAPGYGSGGNCSDNVAAIGFLLAVVLMPFTGGLDLLGYGAAVGTGAGGFIANQYLCGVS